MKISGLPISTPVLAAGLTLVSCLAACSHAPPARSEVDVTTTTSGTVVTRPAPHPKSYEPSFDSAAYPPNDMNSNPGGPK